MVRASRFAALIALITAIAASSAQAVSVELLGPSQVAPGEIFTVDVLFDTEGETIVAATGFTMTLDIVFDSARDGVLDFGPPAVLGPLGDSSIGFLDFVVGSDELGDFPPGLGPLLPGFPTFNYPAVLGGVAPQDIMAFGASTPFGTPISVSGSGIIARVQFQAINVGVTTIEFGRTIFTGVDAADVDTTTLQVTIIPEPSTFLLAGLGLVGGFLVLRRCNI